MNPREPYLVVVARPEEKSVGRLLIWASSFFHRADGLRSMRDGTAVVQDRDLVVPAGAQQPDADVRPVPGRRPHGRGDHDARHEPDGEHRLRLGRGEGGGAAVADEQGRLELVFEAPDLARQRGLGDVRPRGGPPEVQLFAGL
ncbi:hypothetical protein [Amycolatopsis sp. MtRt-6]|uniref:hypothetical protein n=1 Tax=Amycolatopsis sp. MtRt-6 TaxID=2792782 RepID=UPI0035AC1FAC